MAAITPTTRLPVSDPAALRILARSLVRELNKRGYGLHHVVGLAHELIDRACDSFRGTRGP
jgi:hypothetical protein